MDVRNIADKKTIKNKKVLDLSVQGTSGNDDRQDSDERKADAPPPPALYLVGVVIDQVYGEDVDCDHELEADVEHVAELPYSNLKGQIEGKEYLESDLAKEKLQTFNPNVADDSGCTIMKRCFAKLLSNASSGMGVADDCKNIFLELQRKKTHRYVIFKIDEKRKEVIVEKVGAATESYDEFMASLPENDCRYAVYDFDFVTEENCQKSKIFFIAWSPAVSRIRAKMLYATSKDRFRREMDGVHYEIQATDPTEMELDVLRERAH
ncbi:hypothetical protein ZIOFF_013167 [Zingiber officinale]|uniref:ADF-H domain-containing protein n=2 Tax=Zingiber officinale TaxID=94328 RepID=A0A8J5H8Q4_ZINOF|nr:hypothetical protein ZIOFF_013167 [Zingiber officinale]